ncbi:MAG: cytochrome P450 [Actinomycetes bacterium]|nr:MAG: cytochrome P450 [Actinomycetes bacterium]
MSETDWSPTSEAVAADQRAAYDAMRERCPVARDGTGAWTLFRHDDVVAAALDPATFSSRVSRHLNVPNGMDGEEHARFRALIDPYLAPGAVARLEPRFRGLAARLVASLPGDRSVEAVSELGARFAVRAQSAWLGWPAELEDTLLGWMDDNLEATRSRRLSRTAAVAERFDAIVRSLIEARRRAGADAPDDVTTQLLGERIDGRPLSDEEVISILRNWTAGDLGSIAACIGVVVHRLAVDAGLQERLRGSGRGGDELEAEIDEILRIDDPFVSNRRLATVDVEVGGRTVRAGERVVLNWTAANRDPRVMGDPDSRRPAENALRNVVYGIGVHECPGRGLATLELRVAIEELLAATSAIELAPGADPVREAPPRGGYRTVPVMLRPGPGRPTG